MLIIYIFLWIISITLRSWFFIWLLVELLNWSLIIILTSLVVFIIWQRIRRLLMLFSWVILKINLILLIRLVIKIGIPPFLSWALQVNWKWKSWIIFLTLHKCLPIILIIILRKPYILITWPLLSIIFLYVNNEWLSLIWTSSIRDRAWMCLRPLWKYFWIFFIIYSILWITWRFRKTMQRLRFNKPITYIIFILTLAIPPRILFFIKIIIWINLPFFLGVRLRSLSWLLLFFYWKWLLLTIITINSWFKESWPIIKWSIIVLLRHIMVVLS